MSAKTELFGKAGWSVWTGLIALPLIWGSAFALIKIAVVEIPPFTMAAGRIALGAVVLLAIQAALGAPLAELMRPPRLARWRQFLLLGMLGNGIPFVLIGYGEMRIGSGLAAILIGTMPLFTLLFAHLFAVERGFTARALAGIALGFAGLVTLMGPAALAEWSAGGRAEIAAQAMVVLAAVSYAATTVYGRVLTLAMPLSVLASGSLTTCALVMVPLALIIDAPWRLTAGAESVAAVVILGVFATAIASLIYFRLLRAAGPNFTAIINYLIPAFGFLLGVVWLGEPVTLRALAALALILGAIALVRAKAGVAAAPPKP